MAEKPEDLNLPTAVITRMIKEVLPDGVNISKEARAAISKSASVFVLYATSCANNIALQHKRKTLTAADVLEAIEEMEFPSFTKPLQEGLDAFKREQKGKKDAAEIKKKQKAEASEANEKKKATTEVEHGVAPVENGEVEVENGIGELENGVAVPEERTNHNASANSCDAEEAMDTEAEKQE